MRRGRRHGGTPSHSEKCSSLGSSPLPRTHHQKASGSAVACRTNTMRTGVCSRGSTVCAMDIVRQVMERIATGLPGAKEEPTQHSDSSSRAPLTSGEVGSVYLGRMEAQRHPRGDAQGRANFLLLGLFETGQVNLHPHKKPLLSQPWCNCGAAPCHGHPGAGNGEDDDGASQRQHKGRRTPRQGPQPQSQGATRLA